MHMESICYSNIPLDTCTSNAALWEVEGDLVAACNCIRVLVLQYLYSGIISMDTFMPLRH